MDKNSTISKTYCSCCTDEAMLTCSRNCTKEMVNKFSEMITGQLWRVDVLLVVSVILAGIIVGIGAYGNRYRHYGLTRFLLLGATTLFAPIISYVLSAPGSTGVAFTVTIQGHKLTTGDELTAKCSVMSLHPYMVMVSTTLVLISAINTSPVVATEAREDRTIRPPFELLLKGIWIVYLVILADVVPLYKGNPLKHLRFTPFVLIHAKMVLKSYAFLKARKSFALGRNPRLIIGYMQQLREGRDQHGESPTVGEADVNMPPPPLVVMGEDDWQVERQPHGYMFRNNLEARQEGGLVTLDRVWQLDNMFPMPILQQRHKDMCLSFALFKLLRCRFARYKLTDDVISTETLRFVRSVLLKEGEHGRAFRMIADELSFLHDYYDSPLPISYSDSWLTTFSMLISVLSIGYCILSGMDIIYSAYLIMQYDDYTVSCFYHCTLGLVNSDVKWIPFGSMYFDLVPVVLLHVFVMVAEVRDIAFHICSSWTKVILTCRCVHRASLQLSPAVSKWDGYLLQCRCNRLMRHWSDRMGQNSMLVLHPRHFHQLGFPGRLLGLLDMKMKKVGVPLAVKACIIKSIRSIGSGGLSKGITSLHQSQIGESLLWACNSGKGTTDTILVWHIATSIIEVRYPHHRHDDLPKHTRQGGGQPSSISDKKTAATHLSRYCAYLVAFCPELLPDDDAWSSGLYKDVGNEAKRALATAGGTGLLSMPPETAYRRLIELLGARRNHEVLKDAAKLAEQLGELTTGGEEEVWELLSGFWSEMVLYVAPADNINGHMQAIDQGGELITLLWALLTHVGIVDRTAGAAAASVSGY